MTRRGDLLLSAALLVAGQYSVWVLGDAGGAWAGSLTLAVGSVVLLRRREAPLRVAWATVLLQALCAVWAEPDSLVFGIVGIVAWYAVGRWANPRRALMSLVVVCLLSGAAVTPEGSALDWLNLYLSIVLTTFVVPWLAGFLVRTRADGRDRRETTEAMAVPTTPAGVDDHAGTDVGGGPDLSVLSPREREVFALLARGATNSEIAAELFLSVYTVKAHVASILAKLGLRDRVAVVVYAHAPHELR
jgi:DNA-binding CsgD family transcriptional regulator